MAFDGSGIFLRLRNWVADATAGVKIRADFHDTEDDNFASGLSQCIVKDGQTTITQNIPWNSKRITALADPVDPQDAATKAYADTKLAKTGDGTVTGNLTVTGDITAGGHVSATGYQTRKGLPGPYTGSWFNFDWTGSTLDAWVTNTNIGSIATQNFVNTAINPKVNRAGDTITGNLQVNGSLFAVGSSAVFLGTSGSAYLQWNGGGTYTLGGGGTVWHSGNFNPNANTGAITSLQLIFAGAHNHTGEGQSDPFAGGVVCGGGYPDAFPHGTFILRYRYLQAYVNGGWYTVGYVG